MPRIGIARINERHRDAATSRMSDRGAAHAWAAVGRAADTQAAPKPRRPWFEEIAARAGIDFVHHSGHDGRHYLPEIMGGGAALFDMDNDGFLDLYLVQSGNLSNPSAGERQPPVSQSRQRHVRGRDRASGAGIRGYGMGVAAGDFDNDGYTDLYITNFGTTSC